MARKTVEKHKLELKEVEIEVEDTSSYTKIGCPNCGSDVPASDLNINDKIAKCGNCNVVFSFQKEVRELEVAEQVASKPEIIRPEGIDIFHFEEEMDITMDQPISVPEVLLGSLVPFIGLLFILAYFASDKEFPLWLALMGGVASFLSILNLVNRSNHKIFINIDDRFLSIKRRPKKFIQDQQYNISEIDQLYLRVIGGYHHIYMLVNGPGGQKHVKLVSNLQSTSKARFLEQEIERKLGIKDRRVPEETVIPSIS
ncbi:MAG: hypothetical protein KTR30_21455 [Saprospiraceae bacterium]|nr:hypothetical protein [Saprospiraceae bacterium]